MMTNVHSAVILALALYAPLAHSKDFDFSYRGYVELTADRYGINRSAAANQMNWMGLPDRRLALAADATFSVRVGGFNSVLEAYSAAGENLSAYPPQSLQKYLSYTSADKSLFIRAGQVVPNWGVGQIWNPVRDISNEGRRDVIFNNRAIRGMDLAQIQWVMSENSSLSAYYFPARTGRPAGPAMRFASAISDFDYALTLFRGTGEKYRLGAEFSWVLGSAGIVTEVVWSDRNEVSAISPIGAGIHEPGRRLSYVIGANVALPNEFNLNIEVYRNGWGFTKDQSKSFSRYLPANMDLYNPLGNGQKNLYAGLGRHFVQGDSMVTLSAFHNIESAVTMVRASMETRIGKHAKASISLSHYAEPPRDRLINLYRNMVDLRILWSF